MSDSAGITHRPPASMTAPVKSDGLEAGKPASLPSRISTFRVLSVRAPTSNTRASAMYRFCAVAVWLAPITASITRPQAAAVSNLWPRKAHLLTSAFQPQRLMIATTDVGCKRMFGTARVGSIRRSGGSLVKGSGERAQDLFLMVQRNR
jgi:hypothetical protein